jgi:hypothetical protein
MGILLWLVGVLALASGAVKLRSRTRWLAGRSPLVVGEIGAGAVLAVGAGLGLARLRPLAWLGVVVALAVVVASSAVHARRLRRAAEARDQSAERRFRQYIEMPER